MRVARVVRHVVLAALLGSAGIAARAQEGGPPGRQPPHEAYAACEGRQAGEACSVTIAERTLTGTCTPHDNALACRPDRRRHEPPPEAFAACASLTTGAACSIAWGEQQLEGTCQESPDAKLFCRPARPPPPPER